MNIACVCGVLHGVPDEVLAAYDAVTVRCYKCGRYIVFVRTPLEVVLPERGPGVGAPGE